MANGFCTIGHSTRSLDAFVGLLRDAGVGLVADVRSFPHSRRFPAFNTETLPQVLQGYQIGYRHFPDLGGRRNRQPEVPEDLNGFWQNRSFHNYADYALSDSFGQALAELVELGHAQRVALMCAEAVWWRCHRRVIADYLLLAGWPVVHLMGEGREDEARPTPAARRRADGTVIYPASAPIPAPHDADGGPEHRGAAGVKVR